MSRAVALWCALMVAGSATVYAYTVDCNHEYTDCDTELSKLVGEDDEVLPQKSLAHTTTESMSTTTIPPTRSTAIIEIIKEENRTTSDYTTEAEILEVPDATEPAIKPKPRLLNLDVNELQNFANALHNQTNDKRHKKLLSELSDVNLDLEDEDDTRVHDHKNKDIPDKFYTNMQVPFNPLMSVDRGSDEIYICKENEVSYKVGERMDRGCEETCECNPGGVFDCSPRCKHPYIRRGRRLNDPLCFESPVDECCSIIACATGSGDMKVAKLEVCRYGNDTYPVGSKWNIDCEQSCTCEPNSIVTCKPRCNRMPPSDKCINVQDPNDACCEVQVCDVSHDAHEEPAENATSTSSTTEGLTGFEDYEETDFKPNRPLVLSEPIGSVKVLQNNSVQVNLMHMNNSEYPIHLMLSSDGGKTFKDIELKYSNLILSLEGGKDYILKTKETDTKFNFTITATDGVNEVLTEESHNASKIGCYEDGQFYAVGEEFHIGCTELCECTGEDTRECAALICPSHVGLELVSKGCVRWAPSPPANPPNCCPRAARCLSDGTCHYKDVPVPNWSEVPISLTGCEQRCFCENGELDCQEVCTPLPPVPPQSLRCPPNHRPAAVNISDEDCCKQWECVPNTGNQDDSTMTYKIPISGETIEYVTPVEAILPTITPVLSPPPHATPPLPPDDFYRHLSPVKSVPKYFKNIFPVPIPPGYKDKHHKSDNITVFTLDNDESIKAIHKEPALQSNKMWRVKSNNHKENAHNFQGNYKKSHTIVHQSSHSHPEKHINFISSKHKMQSIMHSPIPSPTKRIHSSLKIPTKHEPVRKVSLSKLDNYNYFLPTHERKVPDISYSKHYSDTKPNSYTEHTSKPQRFFEPVINNRSSEYFAPKLIHSHRIREQSSQSSQFLPAISQARSVTILKHKNTKVSKPTDETYDAWSDTTKAEHVLTKEPNPYETVLHRVVPDVVSSYDQNAKIPQVAGKTYSALDLEHLLSQMEVETVINKNLGRSADKGQDLTAGQKPSPNFPPPPPRQQPSFLPTIPPEIHFPQDDIPDDEQNDIHRPLEPALQGLPPGLTLPPTFGDPNKKLSVFSLQADSPTSIKMLFGLPPVLVGLRGSIDLRYTDKADEDITKWYSQVFAPADEVLTTPRLEFRLTGLKPSTTYKVRGKLYLHNLPVEPESEIYTIRTQDPLTPTSVEEKRREIDSRLMVSEVNDTVAHVSWRHFTEDELQFIDGIQVRYRPVGTPIYSMTELLHHSRSAADLHELRPGSRYEASLVLVPPPRASTELIDPMKVEFTTSPFVDPYNWSVIVEARAVGAAAAELAWRGVPAPAERWVRVYRAAHACTGAGTTAREIDAFRLAARDLPATITLHGLEPNARCRVWLELFLTNGKIKTSNVLEIQTKSLDAPDPIDNEIEASSISDSRHSHGDYYGALVGVGVVAALGALASLLLLLVVVRRHRPRSLPITPMPTAPRESSLPPYDNPAYKLELQQETMDL